MRRLRSPESQQQPVPLIVREGGTKLFVRMHAGLLQSRFSWGPPVMREGRHEMKPATIAPFVAVLAICALVLGSASLAAQTTHQVPSSGTAGMEGAGQSSPGQTSPGQTSPAESHLTTIWMPAAAYGCPVSLRAHHGSGGNMVKVDKPRPEGMAQLLHLTLTNPDARQLVAARLRAHGVSGKLRMTQAAQGAADADVHQNLRVTFLPSPDRSVTTNVWVPGMAAVLSLDLDEVTYADGSTWKFQGREGCHVTPDPLMLVAAH